MDENDILDTEMLRLLKSSVAGPDALSGLRYGVISEPTERLAYVVSPLRRRKLMGQ
jgi:hypothetical protein